MHWERVYSSHADQLPWQLDYVPDEVTRWSDLLPKGAAILDIGCGEGAHALTMASRGFFVTGIDLSETAITLARAAVDSICAFAARFEVADIITYNTPNRFDFAFDYSTFHHINPLDQDVYVSKVASLLKSDAYYGLVCYADFDEDAAGLKVRRGRFGNNMSHLSRDELVGKFAAHFRLAEYQTTVLGRKKNHKAHSCLFQRIS